MMTCTWILCTGYNRVHVIRMCIIILQDGLDKFRDMIYVSNDSELNKTILRIFHAKPYLGHRGH